MRIKGVIPCAGVLLFLVCSVFGLNEGVIIKPNVEGVFEYTDSFDTPRFLTEAFLSNLDASRWQKGEIWNSGPELERTLTYRFYGDYKIEAISVNIAQRANQSLRGVSRLYLSKNGLDWTLIDDNTDQQPDDRGYQIEPLTARPEQTKDFTGNTDTWVRVELNCHVSKGASKLVM